MLYLLQFLISFRINNSKSFAKLFQSKLAVCYTNVARCAKNDVKQEAAIKSCYIQTFKHYFYCRGLTNKVNTIKENYENKHF